MNTSTMSSSSRPLIGLQVVAMVGVLVFAGCAGGGTRNATREPNDAPIRDVEMTGSTMPPAYRDPANMEAAASAGSTIIGQQAPDFTLVSAKGVSTRLGDLRGKWVVLYFYPKNDTPGCTCQATEFTGLILQFESVDALVYGISPDTIESHRQFQEKYRLKVELLADPKMGVMYTYGATAQTKILGKDYTRVVRSTVLVDPEGKIAWHWPEVMPEGHAARVLAKLNALKAAKAEKKPATVTSAH